MIRSGARRIAVVATLVGGGCNSDQSVAPPPSIASIVAHLDSVVLADQARGDTVHADFLTAIEIPIVFGAPLSVVQVALDTFEVQRTYEVNTVAWVIDGYAIVDTASADTLLVFTAAPDDDGSSILRSDRQGSSTAGALISGDSVYFAPQPSTIEIATSGGASAPCPTPLSARNPAIVRLRSAKCVLITLNAFDSLTTTFPEPGSLAGIWLTKDRLDAVALIR